jgi:hypothetical protein
MSHATARAPSAPRRARAARRWGHAPGAGLAGRGSRWSGPVHLCGQAAAGRAHTVRLGRARVSAR